MKYLRLIDKQIVYPFHPEKLRREHPGVSFPSVMSAEMLAEFNVFPVTETAPPEAPPHHQPREAEPVIEDGAWRQAWTVERLPVPEEVSAAQIRLFLEQAGMLADVETRIATMSKAVQIEWEYRTEFRRSSPLLNEVADAFKLTPEQVDEFFYAASEL
jgi:hypothetical protein